METFGHGNLRPWKPSAMETFGHGNLRPWKPSAIILVPSARKPSATISFRPPAAAPSATFGHPHGGHAFGHGWPWNLHGNLRLFQVAYGNLRKAMFGHGSAMGATFGHGNLRPWKPSAMVHGNTFGHGNLRPWKPSPGHFGHGNLPIAVQGIETLLQQLSVPVDSYLAGSRERGWSNSSAMETFGHGNLRPWKPSAMETFGHGWKANS